MKLGLHLGYSGANARHPRRAGAARRGARLRLGVDRRGLRLGRGDAARLPRRQDAAHPARHRHHAACRAHAGQLPPCRQRPSMRSPAAAASSPGSAYRARRSSRAGTASPGASPTGASRTTSRSCARCSAARRRWRTRAARSACPTRAPGAMGVGKPLKSILHMHPDIPIYLGTGNEATVKLTAEIADGWLPLGFVPGSMPEYRPWLEEGFRRAGDGKGFAQLRDPGLRACGRRRRREGGARQAQAGGRALRRRHGPPRQELPQGHDDPPRLRRGRRAHPGALPRRTARRRRSPPCPTSGWT